MSQAGIDEKTRATLLDRANGPCFAKLEKTASGVERRRQQLHASVDVEKRAGVWSGLGPRFRAARNETNHDQDTDRFLHQVLRRCRLVASTMIVRSSSETPRERRARCRISTIASNVWRSRVLMSPRSIASRTASSSCGIECGCNSEINA